MGWNAGERPCGGQFWAGPEPSAVPAALTALATVYTVAMDRPVTTHRTWLDSADLRLYRSGMALTATAGPDGDERSLELSSADGSTVTAGPDTLGWPRLLACLPDQLRPRLEPVLGVRALLPVVQVIRHVRHRQVARRRGQDRAAAGPRTSGHDLREPRPAARRAVADPAAGVRRGRRARRPDRAAAPGWFVTTASATRRRCAPRGVDPDATPGR